MKLDIFPDKYLEYKLPISLAVGLHLILLLLLIYHFHLMPTAQTPSQAVNIIKASVVTETPSSPPVVAKPIQQINTPPEAEVSKIEQREMQPKKEVQVKPKPPEPKKITEPLRKNLPSPLFTKEGKKEDKKEAKKKIQELTQQLADQQIADEQKAKRKEQKQKQLKKIKALAEQELQDSVHAAQKQQKALTTAKQKKLAQASTQQLIQQELSAETPAQAETTPAAAENNGEIDKYKSLIIQAIGQQWIVPDTAKKDEEAKLLVKCAPGGVVLSVEIIKSSGDPVLDRSAQAAVLKASPLPVPKEAQLFENFRLLRLTVRPEGIVG